MSVAFRREGDGEYLEPKFELPFPSGRNLGTEPDLAQICDEVTERETAPLGAICATGLHTCRWLNSWMRLAAEELPSAPQNPNSNGISLVYPNRIRRNESANGDRTAHAN